MRVRSHAYTQTQLISKNTHPHKHTKTCAWRIEPKCKQNAYRCNQIETTKKNACTRNCQKTQTCKHTQQQGVGRGRGTTARGRTVGHRGNSNRRGVPPGLRVGTAGAPAPVGAAVVVVPGVGRTRLSGRGTHQRAKPPPNIPGEDRPAFTLFSLFTPIFY